MRAIKIILGILIALSVVFFATGLVVKEVNYSAEVTVNKSLKETFATFNNIELANQWIPELKSIDTVNYNPGYVGSKFKMVVTNNGQDMVLNEKVMAFVPKEKVTLQFEADTMLKTDDYTFSSNGSSTKITLNANCQGNSYMTSCIFPYFKRTFKSIDQGYLDNFKQYLESQ